jgi:hypothetical protein
MPFTPAALRLFDARCWLTPIGPRSDALAMRGPDCHPGREGTHSSPADVRGTVFAGVLVSV